MNISDQKLRDDRLVFYAQDVDRLDQELDGFLELSGARCALLIDREGHLVTRRGEAASSSVDSLSALTAGSFAATDHVPYPRRPDGVNHPSLLTDPIVPLRISWSLARMQ